jgi:hypothetical protein
VQAEVGRAAHRDGHLLLVSGCDLTEIRMHGLGGGWTRSGAPRVLLWPGWLPTDKRPTCPTSRGLSLSKALRGWACTSSTVTKPLDQVRRGSLCRYVGEGTSAEAMEPHRSVRIV